MEHYPIGLIIKNNRNRLGLTQEDLCESDIMDVRTIQRIESGKFIPQEDTIKIIFSKMGLKSPINLRKITEEEYIFYRLYEKIEEETANYNYDIKELLEQYKSVHLKKDLYDQQFYYLHQAQYESEIVKDYKTAKNTYFLALKQTIKSFENGYDLNKQHYATPNELMSLYGYAFMELKLSNYKNAEKYFISIKNYLEKYFSEGPVKPFLYANVVLKLSEIFRMNKDYKRMALFCRQAVKFIAMEDSLEFMEELLEYELEGARAISNKEIEDEARLLYEAVTMKFDD